MCDVALIAVHSAGLVCCKELWSSEDTEQGMLIRTSEVVERAGAVPVVRTALKRFNAVRET